VNYAALLEALQQASGFELFRLRAAIDRALSAPERIDAIRRCIKRGQRIEYFDARDNRLYGGLVLEMRNTTLVILDTERAVRILIDYAALNLDGADTVIRDSSAKGIDRQEVAVGDFVGFQDRDGNQRHGKVVRLNSKTVTLDCNGHPWRVAYTLLHRKRPAIPSVIG
jgi:hypothetical protein